MKLSLLSESPEPPRDIFQLMSLTSASKTPWDAHENPGDLRHGDPCPKCRQQVTNRRPYGLGAPLFLGCNNAHAFLLPGVDVKDPDFERIVDKVEEDEFGHHTCRFPPDDLDDEELIRAGRRNGCEACAAMYEFNMDREFGSAPDPVAADDDGDGDGDYDDEEVSHFYKQLRKFDPRQHHQRGEFGTGSPEAIQPYDSPLMAFLKGLRDRDVKRDPRTGRGLRMRDKDKCGFGHTCGFYPNGRPAWNYPLPDPMATLKTGRGRFNNWFKYKGERQSLFNMFPGARQPGMGKTPLWPVSGVKGWIPKAEFEEFVEKKYNCPACLRRDLGEERAIQFVQSGENQYVKDPEKLVEAIRTVRTCDNPVSHQYGAEKPFCAEHFEAAPYVQELYKKYPKLKLPSEAGGGWSSEYEKTGTPVQGDYSHRLRKPYPDPKTLGGTKTSFEIPKFFKEQARVIKLGDPVMIIRGRGSKMYRSWGPGRVREVDPDMFDGEPGFLVNWPNHPKGAWFSQDQLDVVPENLDWPSDF